LASREETEVRVGMPRGKEARSFYRSGRERLTDARVLLDAGRTTGSIYLAGYGVECIVTALILSVVPDRQWAAILDTFRGTRGHDFRWLMGNYLEYGGSPPPPGISKQLSAIATWSTELRYEAGTMDSQFADDYMDAVAEIMEWAGGRL
jgi:hypothetical protein